MKKIASVTLDDVLSAVEINFDEARLAAAIVGNVDKPLELN